MIEIDLLLYHEFLNISAQDGKRWVLDPVRKKKVVLQPEEMVRQAWIHYLNQIHEISFAAMSVEKSIKVNGLERRYDLVVYKAGVPRMLLEFKSFNESLSKATCEQIAQYNLSLRIPFLVLSNGEQHYIYVVDFENQAIEEVAEFPQL